MTIDFTDSLLSISNAALQSNQTSQLRFWGLRGNDHNSLEFSGIDAEKVLIKVIRYLIKEKVRFSTSKRCAERIAFIENRTTDFQNTRQAAKEFKNGKFNKPLFKEFTHFLESHLYRKLKPHQLKSAFHLYLVRNGANFSVPGSGKTSVVLSVFQKLREEKKVNVLFVVGPPACFGPWKNEFVETIGRKPNYRILAGGEKKSRKGEYFANSENMAELYLTTFQTLINDQSEISTFFSQKGINIFLVIDEAHYIKQVNGNWANAVLNLAKHSKFRCILTGTPIPKGFSDIYNLFDFLWPESEPIESSAKLRLQSLEKSNKVDEAKEILESRVGPLFYRVRKSDLGLTKPKYHEPIIIPMNKYEQKLYDAIEKQIRSYAMDDYLINIDFINKLRRGRMIRLRQCASYLPLLNKTIDNYDEDILNNDKDLRHIVRNYDTFELPAKIQFLVKKVKELQSHKHKVVIWTNFVGTIEKLKSYFSKNLGLYCESIYGKTPIEQTTISDERTREQIRDEFVNPTSGLDILIANPAACAESISLHKTCHNAIYYDLTYNCAQYLQSLDRIHRVGGSETVIANYYFLQYANSIDQDILTNLRTKAQKMKRIIDDDFEIYSMDMFADDDDDIKAYARLFAKK